jgi:hypothetical protein
MRRRDVRDDDIESLSFGLEPIDACAQRGRRALHLDGCDPQILAFTASFRLCELGKKFLVGIAGELEAG